VVGKKTSGRAGGNDWVLLTTAYPQVGILMPTAGGRFLEIRDGEIRQRSAFAGFIILKKRVR
ncbi:hypothetical protein, partial [Ignatzschineria indica]